MSRLALTFDDGPGEWTEPILDVLSAQGARATFFVIGSAAQSRPDVVRRVAAEGHEVGNHTWSHPRLAQDCDDDVVYAELERTNLLLAELLGSPPRRFRAPRYDVDERVIAVAQRLGLQHAQADVRPPDWDERCTAGFIATFVLQQAKAGTIVGLHDGLPPRAPSTKSRQATVDAVTTIVPRLKDRGFECVTIGTLVGDDGRA